MQEIVLSAEKYLKSNDDIHIQKDTVRERCTMHAHAFIELAYISEGKGTHTVCGAATEVSSGDFILLNQHVAHEFVSDPMRPLVVYNCIFQPLSVDSELQQDGNFVDMAYQYLLQTLRQEGPRDYLQLHDTGRQSLEPILKEMFQEYQLKKAGYRQMMKADLIKLLILCFRLCRQQPGKGIFFYELAVNQAVAYLQVHFAQPIRCEDLASRAYLSLSYFSKIFKRMTGLSIVQMLQNIRMQNACELLRAADLPISEVAERVGYSDIKYFYKLFEQSKGLTPGAYRRESRIK